MKINIEIKIEDEEIKKLAKDILGEVGWALYKKVSDK